MLARVDLALARERSSRPDRWLAQALVELRRDPARVVFWREKLARDPVVGPALRPEGKAAADPRWRLIRDASDAMDLIRAWLRRRPPDSELVLRLRPDGGGAPARVALMLEEVRITLSGVGLYGQVGAHERTIQLGRVDPSQMIEWAEEHVRLLRWSERRRGRSLGALLVLCGPPWAERGQRLIAFARRLEAKLGVDDPTRE